MSHYLCMVIINKSHEGLQHELGRLLKPYCEHIEVDEYERICRCTERNDGVAHPNCRYCRGNGKYLTNYNPNSKWDYYDVCGIWPTRELAEDDLVPFAYVTPDGQWHQIATIGLYSINEECMVYEDWYKQCNNACRTHSDSITVMVNCHI